MKPIKVGTVPFQVEQFASQGNAVLGIRDSGKSYTATRMAEQLMEASVPIIAIDPIGIWRFLRTPGTGPDAKGYRVVVAGGKHGDLPLTPAGAPEIVRAAMREHVSLVLDLYSMDLSKADWRKIVAASIRTLLYENGEHGLRHVFIEEASEFCPQVVGPEQGVVYAEVEKLARMGGNAQLGYTLINQRAEQVNKAVLELCDCLILHRQKGRLSLAALTKWLDIGLDSDDKNHVKDIIKSLPRLEQGECWVWPAGESHATRTRGTAKHSFHPDRRARFDAKAVPREPVPVEAFVAAMQTSLEALAAETAANDPAALLKEIAELKKMATHPSREITREMAAEGERAAFQRGITDACRSIQAMATGLQNDAATLYKRLEEMIGRAVEINPDAATPLSGAARATWDRPMSRQPAERRGPYDHAAPKPNMRSAEPRRAPGDTNGLGKAERSILTALVQSGGKASKEKVAIMAGYAHTGGAFNNALGALRSANLISKGSPIEAYNGAASFVPDAQALPTGLDLVDYWRGRVGKAGSIILSVLADKRHANGIDKSELGQATGYEASGGSFNNALGRLRTLGLITRGQPVMLAPEIFE